MLLLSLSVLLIIAGIFVNGPYGLITTAVSADLGTHECLKGSSKALATVTAIIDGTGSMGKGTVSVFYCSIICIVKICCGIVFRHIVLFCV